MALSGVRSSWLMLARNSLFDLLADSAALLGVGLRAVGQRAVGDVADDDDDLAAVVGEDADLEGVFAGGIGKDELELLELLRATRRLLGFSEAVGDVGREDFVEAPANAGAGKRTRRRRRARPGSR